MGLRELGIAGEHGLSSLTVPKKLLKGKDKRLGAVPDGYAVRYNIVNLRLLNERLVPNLQCETCRTPTTISHPITVYPSRFKQARRPDRTAQTILHAEASSYLNFFCTASRSTAPWPATAAPTTPTAAILHSTTRRVSTQRAYDSGVANLCAPPPYPLTCAFTHPPRRPAEPHSHQDWAPGADRQNRALQRSREEEGEGKGEPSHCERWEYQRRRGRAVAERWSGLHHGRSWPRTRQWCRRFGRNAEEEEERWRRGRKEEG